MKTNLLLKSALVTMLFALVQTGRATLFFSDTFSSGSTLNSLTPAIPTATSASYQMISAKGWSPAPTMTANDLKFGIATTTGGTIETETVFTTNTIALVQPGDYIQVVLTFTNTSGLLTASGQLDIGLYNSGQVNPVAGGLNGTATSTSPAVTGAAQNWVGYAANIYFSGSNNRILTRAAQTSTAGNSQDLLTSGSSSESYNNPAGGVMGTAVASTVALTVGSVYTEVLNISLNATGSEGITNSLYSGGDTNGTLIVSYGAVATNTTFLASGFDGFAFGWLAKANTTGGTVADISSIQITGLSTPVTSPPTINTQPVPVNVATGGSSAFTVAATGFNVTYQWARNGTNLLNGGNISGATSSTLAIVDASTADVFSGANGYYCVVSGAGGFSTNTVTNSLTLVTAKNLVWSGAGNVWDLNNSVSWVNGATPATFNYGDNVTFNDTGAGNPVVTLTGSYLSPQTWTISGTTSYEFDGTGSFAGDGVLVDAASGFETINTDNTYTGGTIISNAATYVTIGQYQALGTGPITLAQPGTLEVVPIGSATLGLAGDINLNDNFTIQFDGVGTFAGVIMGSLNGGAGKTLTFTQPAFTTTNRYRLYGTNTVFDGNIVVNGPAVPQAAYNGTVIAPYNSIGAQTFNGVISGNGGLVQRGSATTVLNGQSTYVGGTYLTTGGVGVGADTTPTSGTVISGPVGAGPIFVVPEVGSANGSGTILAANGAHTIANPIEYPSATNNQTLIIGGTNNLTFTGNMPLQGQDGLGGPLNRTIQANNTAASTISGVISDGGLGYGLIKTGTNALYLNGVNTYTGPTTNSAGLLTGTGTIAGSVYVQTNASIGGGSAASIGTLNIGGSLATIGNGFFRLNRSGLVSDKVSVAGTIANIGTTNIIVVTNLGSALQVNDRFVLFNKLVTGGANFTITGGGMNWANNLATDGSITATSIFVAAPPVLTNSFSGGVLKLSWPAANAGWHIEIQTNTLANGLGTNWVSSTGTTSVTTTNFPADSGNAAVFYRLAAPGF